MQAEYLDILIYVQARTTMQAYTTRLASGYDGGFPAAIAAAFGVGLRVSGMRA